MLEDFIRCIEKSSQMITDFDDRVWLAAVKKVTDMNNDQIVFNFRDGTEVCK